MKIYYAETISHIPSYTAEQIQKIWGMGFWFKFLDNRLSRKNSLPYMIHNLVDLCMERISALRRIAYMFGTKNELLLKTTSLQVSNSVNLILLLHITDNMKFLHVNSITFSHFNSFIAKTLHCGVTTIFF